MTLAVPLEDLDPWSGRVRACECGVLQVSTARGEVRATYSGRMLGRIARDRSLLAAPGDQVALRWWPDGRVTVEDVVAAVPRSAAVLELHRR